VNETILHQPPTRPWGTANVSPFCAKLETYFRMAEVPYKAAKFGRGQSPTGKIPYIVLDGKFTSDSQVIVEEIERRRVAEGKPAIDAGLSAAELALARMTRRALEEGFYFVMLYLRWGLDANFPTMRAEFKKMLPGFIVPLIRRDIKKKLHAQGTGRHAEDTAMAMGVGDMEAVSDLLGDKPFFLGDTPRTIDATVFAFVDTSLRFPNDNPIKQATRKRANLVAYSERVRERWWKDLATA
jgi:glutathione S-transferase